ncbi:MAG: glycosyltransferase [Myxococcota bacterium]
MTDPRATLIVGVHSPPPEDAHRLRQRFPNARWIGVGSQPVEEQGWENLAGARLASLFARGWDTVVALQPYAKLRALVLGIPARQRLLFESGVLVPWDAVREAKSIAQKIWTWRRPVDTHGYGNDYGFLVPELSGGTESLPRISVIVPVYNRRTVLAKTLVGLASQRYPRSHYEVIVADDGSSDDPESLDAVFSSRMNLRWVRQEDRGYRLSAVRNLAIRASTNEVVVSLDCDMFPSLDLLSAYARWFRAANQVAGTPRTRLLVVGDRAFVDSDSVTVEELLDAPASVAALPRIAAHAEIRTRWRPERDWRKREIERTRELRNHARPYTLASGGNVAFRRADALDAGLYDESFQHWGGEDADFAFRLTELGAYVVFEPDALAFHQHHPPSVQREDHRRITQSQLGARVPYYRRHCREPIVRPEVSVYIPAHNAEDFIESALTSVLTQEFSDVEVCVANDGSSDGTGPILERLAREHARVRVCQLSQPRGIAGASKAAVELARGEFILQLDADDALLPGAVWELLRVLRAEPQASLAYGGFVQVNADGHVLRENLGEPFSWERALLGNIASHPRMFRRRDYERTTGFDPALENAVDFDFYLKLAEVGRVIHVPKILYRYRMHGKNTSIAKRAIQATNHRKVAREVLARRGFAWTLDSVDPGDPSRYRLIDRESGVVRPSWSKKLQQRAETWIRK